MTALFHKFMACVFLILIQMICLCGWSQPVLNSGKNAFAPRVEKFVYKKTEQGNLSLYVHYPKNWTMQDQRPAIIFFFGGGWEGGTMDQFLPQARYFASRGMVTVRADYRVRSRHLTTPETSVTDGKSAIRWLRKNAHVFGIDPNRIVGSGGSAGGHVASCSFFVKGMNGGNEDFSISSEPNLLVLFNPVLTLMDSDFLKKAVSEESARIISPNLHLRSDAPPTIVFYGTKDKFIAHGQELVRKSDELGCDVDIFIAEGEKHGFFNHQPWLNETMIQADRFLEKYGYLSGKPTISPVVPQAEVPPISQPTPKPKKQTIQLNKDEIQTGRFRVSFEENHPYSRDREIQKRTRITLGAGKYSGFYYDIKNESYEVYVPKNYDYKKPFGLLVWISASQNGGVPSEYISLMDEYNLIWIGANQSGNDEDVYRLRIPLALDAVFNMRRHYNINTDRIYISGISGGGRVSSSTAFHHSDVYAGGIFVLGANYWRTMSVPGMSGKFWIKGFLLPNLNLFKQAQRYGRYVLLTGEYDSNREQMELFYKRGYRRELNYVLYLEVPKMKHTLPPAEWFEPAIQFLDNPKDFLD